NGTTQTPAAVEFDTANCVAYTIGSSANDGVLALQTAGSSTVGAIAVTSTVTTNQVINSAITLPAAGAFITNSGAGNSLSLNGGITLPSAGLGQLRSTA